LKQKFFPSGLGVAKLILAARRLGAACPVMAMEHRGWSGRWVNGASVVSFGGHVVVVVVVVVVVG